MEGDVVYLRKGAQVAPPPSGSAALIFDADGAPVMMGSDGGRYSFTGGVTTYGPTGGSVDDAPMINTFLARAVALGGSVVTLPRGVFRVKTRIDYPGNCIRLVGQGPGITTLLLDDSAGLTDGVRMQNRYLNSLEHLTIDAAATRTAGVAISIQGGDAAVLLNGVATAAHSIVNVELLNQFSGMEIIDGPGTVATWIVNLDCRMNRWECNNGGTGMLINSTGGIHYLRDTFITKTSGATALLYQVRIRACKDANLTRITGTYGTDGLRIDPAAGQEITAINIRDMRCDTLTGVAYLIAPAAGVTHCRQVDIVNSWAGNVFGGVIVGGACHAISVRGNQLYAVQTNPGIMVGQSAGPAGVNVDDNEVGGNATAIYLANSVQDVQVRHNTAVLEYGFTPTVGCLVDAGCDRYVIAGNNLRRATTPLTNTPGTSAGRREVYGNITV